MRRTYVRFPSDGDVGGAVYPGRTAEAPGRVVSDFVTWMYSAASALHVRISTAVFGLYGDA